MKAVFVDGSPAANSRVGVLLHALRSRLESQGLDTAAFALLDTQLPINNPQYHNRPMDNPDQAVRDFIAHIQGAAAVVFGTPLYHGSYSGLLKMAIDHLPDDALAGKHVVVVSNASSARSSAQAAHELVPVIRALKGDVLSRLIGTCQDDYGVHEGVFQVTDPGILKRLDLVADELAAKILR